MFQPSAQAKLEAAWVSTFNLLAQLQVVWTRTAPPAASATLMMAIRTPGQTGDADIINAFGEKTSVFVAKVSDMPVKPEKFDQLSALGAVYSVEQVRDRIVGNAVLFYDIAATRVSA